MASLSSLVSSEPLKLGVTPGVDVRALQVALSQAGYRVDVTPDNSFTSDTDYWVRQFQQQHGLKADGVVGALTAAALDADPAQLVAKATPLIVPPTYVDTGLGHVAVATPPTPHDDTASLVGFYGKPWEDSSLLTQVPVPFRMTYQNDDGSLTDVRTIRMHRKVAPLLEAALTSIATAALSNPDVLRHVTHFSGSYNYRPIRGSSRLSSHAFGAAIDFDAARLPFTYKETPASEMPQAVVDAFRKAGAFWGNDYRSRKDPMHFQWAHE
jgi:hypothetical protein